MSETDKINEISYNLEKTVIDQIYPKEDFNKIDVTSLLAWIKQPFAFIMGLSLKTQIYMTIFFIVLVFVVKPMIEYMYSKLYAYRYPLCFNLKHVLIIGGSDGLGKALAKEFFMKGALITLVG